MALKKSSGYTTPSTTYYQTRIFAEKKRMKKEWRMSEKSERNFTSATKCRYKNAKRILAPSGILMDAPSKNANLTQQINLGSFIQMSSWTATVVIPFEDFETKKATSSAWANTTSEGTSPPNSLFFQPLEPRTGSIFLAELWRPQRPIPCKNPPRALRLGEESLLFFKPFRMNLGIFRVFRGSPFSDAWKLFRPIFQDLEASRISHLRKCGFFPALKTLRSSPFSNPLAPL